MSSMFRGPMPMPGGMPAPVSPQRFGVPGGLAGGTPPMGGNTFLGAMGRMNPQAQAPAPSPYVNGPNTFLSGLSKMQGGAPASAPPPRNTDQGWNRNVIQNISQMQGGTPGPAAMPQGGGMMPGSMPVGPAVSPMRGIGGLVMPNGGMPGMMPGGPAVSPMRQPGGMVPGQPMDPRMAIASALLGRK